MLCCVQGSTVTYFFSVCLSAFERCSALIKNSMFSEYFICLQILLYLFTDYTKEWLYSPSKLPPNIFTFNFIYWFQKTKRAFYELKILDQR